MKNIRNARSIFCTSSIATLVVALILSSTSVAQTYTVIHSFTGGSDGGVPMAGLTVDRGGNLYGTASQGADPSCSSSGCGEVFRLQPRGSNWVFLPLHSFSRNEGFTPTAAVTFGPDGRLYGTTQQGGIDNGCYSYGTCGTVFSLHVPSSVCKTVSCPWVVDTIYELPGGLSGGTPSNGPVAFDSSGNLYGTFIWDGSSTCFDDGPCGGIYLLSPQNGQWSASNIVYFGQPTLTGAFPAGGVVVDNSGAVYGAVTYDGSVYKAFEIGGVWSIETIATLFGGSNGTHPLGCLLLDQSRNLFGTTATEGTNGGGTAFELTASGGGWILSTLYSFVGNSQFDNGPRAELTMDSAGNLYGTTYAEGAFGYGSVFKLTHTSGGWTYTSLHDFTGGTDGAFPISTVRLDAAGNLYGTASIGGASVGSCKQGLGCGVVWKIAP